MPIGGETTATLASNVEEPVWVIEGGDSLYWVENGTGSSYTGSVEALTPK